jgi:hypothetical protein
MGACELLVAWVQKVHVQLLLHQTSNHRCLLAWGLSIMGNLALYPSNKALLVNAGVCELICAMYVCQEIAETLCTLIAWIATENADNQQRLGEAGACRIIMECTQYGSGNNCLDWSTSYNVELFGHQLQC